jgi:hypothetical protein
MMTRTFNLALTLLLAGAATAAHAAEDSTGELARDTQNPVADLISVPFQNNFNFGAGVDNEMIWNTNVQPVIPFHLSDSLNLITRTIIPIIDMPSLAPGLDDATGMGDINASLFLSPSNTEGFVWGAGLTTTVPTASDSILGSGQWSMGPTAVGLLMRGPWVVGTLVNQQWSVVGWRDTKVNQLLVQPFVNYNLSDGWYLTSAPIITGNFSAGDGNHWTLPVGGGVGRLWRVGQIGLPVNTSLVPFYNAVSPDFGPDWQLRFSVQFLFPR